MLSTQSNVSRSSQLMDKSLTSKEVMQASQRK